MSGADSVSVYESAVTQVGGQVEAFLGHGLLIFFGAGSPPELHDISVLHEATLAEDGPRPGDTIHLSWVT
jgi:PTS system glucitol/sorbitol-specific IIA component